MGRMRRDCVAELDDWIAREIREEDPRSYLRWKYPGGTRSGICKILRLSPAIPKYQRSPRFSRILIVNAAITLQKL